MIEGTPVKASLDGVLRGLIQEGFPVKKRLKNRRYRPSPGAGGILRHSIR